MFSNVAVALHFQSCREKVFVVKTFLLCEKEKEGPLYGHPLSFTALSRSLFSTPNLSLSLSLLYLS